jgi:HEAT repeat protein/beta-lactamase regulating signal transducer with metallopeptidase domain
MSAIALPLAAWLLTYALHSTLLLCAAALLARHVRGEAWRETLWKAALVGGLLTATAQTVSGYRPPVGRWTLEPVVAIQVQVAGDVAPAVEASPAAEEPAQAARRPVSTEPIASTPPAQPAAGASSSAQEPASIAPTESTARLSLQPLADLAIVLWMLVAGLMMVRIAWRQSRLWRMLRGRADVTDPAVLGMMAGLRRNAGIWRPVRLTVCDAAPTPLALGGGEICVPPRFLTDLDAEQQRSALAHELAHLARRDAAWHFAAGVIEAVFFFQPLNRMARLRLRDSAEFLADEWAARQTGSPLGLARCLAEVASWVAPGRSPIPTGTLAMAEGGSPLVQRVQRLTAWRGGDERGGMTRVAGAAALVLAVAFAAPAVASSGARGGEAEAVRQGAAEGAVGGGSAASEAKDGIIRHPRPAEPLADRWAWAVAEIGRRRLERAWIAYSVPSVLRPGHTWVSDSGDFGIGELGRASVNQVVGAPEQDVVMIFSVARDGELERVSGRSAAGFDFGRQPVLWLGGAEGAASFAQLRRLADGAPNPDLRENVVEAIGVHRGDAMVPYLAAVLGRDGSNGVRREAAQALGHHPGNEALAALATAVERDGSDDVRREAVEAIGAMRHPDSVTLLRTIATTDTRAQIRRTAVEAIGDTGGEALRELGRMALESADPAVARQAAESLEDYPAEQAAPLLERIAWTGQPEAAKQAAESLGRFPPPWAVVALDSIARTHPDRMVAKQAVEALGGVAGGVPDGYLQNLARTHPDRAVREEARDHLAKRARRAGDGIDPDVELPKDPDF